jgi:hypothetical protein
MKDWFPSFTRYFLAKGRDFEMIAGDLVKHREANQNGLPALVLRDDIPRLRAIIRSKMGFLKQTYARYRNTDPPDEAINKDLIKLHI